MSFTLIDNKTSQTIDLGPSLELLAAFKRISELDEDAHPHMLAVPQMESELITREIRSESQDALAKYGAKLDEHARWILEQLAGQG